MNLSDRIEKSISVTRRDLLRLVAQEATARRLPLYAVGGFARDLSLERRVRDFDLVVEGDAIPFARSLARKHGGRVTAHEKFRTATWFLPPQSTSEAGKSEALDLISARSETYEHPAALPTVKMGTLTDDLRRRDFTINALAIRLDGEHFGEMRDDLDGMADLERGLIRVLHPHSFIDDPTRIFRAVRYAQRYGFEIAPETLALMPEASRFVDKLSPERLRHELDLIFEEEDSVPMLAQLAGMRVFQHIQPVLPWDDGMLARFEKTCTDFSHTRRAVLSQVERNRDCRWMVWLMGLLAKEIRALAKRLHFTADLSKKVLAASSIFCDLDSFKGMCPSQCAARLDGLPEDSILAAALCAPPSEPRLMLENYLMKWRDVKPFTTGEMLKSLGVKPGPRFGEILLRLREAWLDGIVVTEEEENFLLDRLLRG
jgi:tRNA nucleotidyltransferase (CCA-adding enzyme)